MILCKHVLDSSYKNTFICKRANIRGGFNFAIFAVTDFSAKLRPPRSFYNNSVYSYLWLDARTYTIIREIKTTAKGPYQENREILTPRNKNLLQYMFVQIKTNECSKCFT